MIVLGFFFAAVSGNLVGMIGSSNNPISGLMLCTLVIAALLMVALGVRGISGVAVVLGVAAVVCVSSAVAGEMLQDLKVGHILGGTPAKMQIGEVQTGRTYDVTEIGCFAPHATALTELGPGEAVYIDKGVVHASYTLGDEPAKLTVILTPTAGEGGYEVIDVFEEEPLPAVRAPHEKRFCLERLAQLHAPASA